MQDSMSVLTKAPICATGGSRDSAFFGDAVSSQCRPQSKRFCRTSGRCALL